MCLRTERIRNYFNVDGLSSASILSLLVDSSGKVWVGTRSGLCCYIPEQDNFKRVEFVENFNSSVTALMEDKAGNFWIGTAVNGVYQCNKQMQVINHYDRRAGLPDNSISTLYEDSYHRIWVGCQFGGLNRIDVRNHKITSYVSANSGLKNNYVRCLAEWDGEMLIGTFDGIYAYAPLKDQIRKVSSYDEPGRGLGHFSIYAFCRDHTGTLWIGFDYLGEPTPYNKDLTNLLNFSDPNELEKARKELEELSKIKTPSRSSYFGIVDLCGFPKDRYYNYKSYWRPDVPTVHILPHWKWQERIGEITPVHIYTSGDAVELFLNGKSLGRREKAHSYDRLTWDDVRYEPGSLRAIAYKNGQKWAEELVETTGKPAALQVTAEKTELKNDGTDLSFIRVAVVDSQGRVVPRSKNHLKFSVTGPAEIIATDNGDATSLLPFQLSERDAYNGLALVILRSQYMKQGKVVLTVESKGLPKQKIALKVE